MCNIHLFLQKNLEISISFKSFDHNLSNEINILVEVNNANQKIIYIFFENQK